MIILDYTFCPDHGEPERYRLTQENTDGAWDTLSPAARQPLTELARSLPTTEVTQEGAA